MNFSTLFICLLALAALAFFGGRRRIELRTQVAGERQGMASLPLYYGLLTALWCLLPATLILLFWTLADGYVISALLRASLPAEQQQLPASELNLLLSAAQNLAAGQGLFGHQQAEVVALAEHIKTYSEINRWAKTVLVLVIAMSAAVIVWLRIAPKLNARRSVEKLFQWSVLASASIAILITIGIVFSVLIESSRFFEQVPIQDFLFGTHWSPQTAMYQDQVGSSGSFGAVPIFVGTLLVSAVAMLVAVPTGLMAAIYLAEYASKRTRNIVKPMLEVLAGIPTVVYGFFAALTVAPAVRDLFATFGVSVSSESALAAGFVMGIMIIPFVSSLSDDVITAVPNSLRQGALALGATPSETVKTVVIPAALPGIVGGVLLAVSRAIGETMIVVMAAGLAANLTLNPLESVTTVTVQIVTLLVGDQEFDSAKTLAAFALGLVLFLITLGLNFFALHVVKKYREQYE